MVEVCRWDGQRAEGVEGLRYDDGQQQQVRREG